MRPTVNQVPGNFHRNAAPAIGSGNFLTWQGKKIGFELIPCFVLNFGENFAEHKSFSDNIFFDEKREGKNIEVYVTRCYKNTK